MTSATRGCLVILFIISLALLSTVQGQVCTQRDEQALLAFQAQLRCNIVNDPTNNACPFDSWVAGTDCCQWDGVNCDSSSQRRVIGLQLNGSISLGNPTSFQITRVPSSRPFGTPLVQLTRLLNLELTFVDVNAKMPEARGSISTLKTLVIRGGRIYGDLPTAYGGLVNLESFVIENAAFGVPVPARGASGRAGIPRELCKLRKLVTFHLELLNLGGTIPDCIGRWSSLREFVVRNGGGNGDFSGRDPTYSIPNAAGLTGGLPAGLFGLTSLTSIDLNTNRLTGSLSTSIGRLINLESLNLGNNRLSGQLPREVGNLMKLQFLYLNGNHFSQQLSSSLGKRLKALVELDLGSNKFSGPIPEAVLNILTLEVLRLDDNGFTGKLPKGNLPGSRSVSNLRLNVSLNYISGPLDPRLLPPNTQDLYVCCQHRKLARTGIPSSISVLKSLAILDLHDNQLGGTIPTSFDQLPDLDRVDLSYNNLRGEVPPAIEELRERANLKGNPLLSR
ncbi:hypothetical protein R1flu_027748 [Riccia fluitans]|uniref:Leucine-rich repeat-containing N-terminal plant-type domain-containing protein n=1 Tax=Riccia fluitans TaxID=41844 RepID=A0ABD1XK65_9MARC